MSNPNECYFNGGMWDGKFLPLPPTQLQIFARRSYYSDKKTVIHRYERVESAMFQFKEETTESLPSVKYQPRNEIVLIRIELVDTNKAGIALPESSLESKRYVVEAFGPKVEDLQVGDVVFLIGEQGEQWNYYPGCKDLILTHQQYVLLKIVGGE